MEPHILYRGPVDRRTGVLTFVEACARLHADGLHFRATVLGDGPDMHVARNLRRRLGAHRVIGFATTLPDTAADIVVGDGGLPVTAGDVDGLERELRELLR